MDTYQYDSLRDLLVPVVVGIMIELVGGIEIHQLALARAMVEAIVAMIWAAIMMDHRVVALSIEELDTIIIHSLSILLNHKTHIMNHQASHLNLHLQIMVLLYSGAFTFHIHIMHSIIKGITMLISSPHDTPCGTDFSVSY